MPEHKSPRNFSSEKRSLKSILLKILGVILIILTPIFLIELFIFPLIPKNPTSKYPDRYRLPENFTKGDLANVISRMAEDQEFAFYFHSLTKKNIQEAVDEVYKFLDQYQEKDSFLYQLKLKQDNVKSLAILFKNFEFSEEFIDDPLQYPELCEIFFPFLYEEFLLTIIGVCYKSNYDVNFQFVWDEHTQQAAKDLKDLIDQLGPQRLSQIADFLGQSL